MPVVERIYIKIIASDGAGLIMIPVRNCRGGDASLWIGQRIHLGPFKAVFV
ncbi:hypothetical protein M3610_19735 [Neobacillus sp. MER 74]|uniref:hypothetical protein n=1 Tax=Neobacillus sp. MER 74 TaxID=2939566 RepID=UPI0020424D3E|nr:hypothetical protein [Neobacillus sp. MER 74]MCM3117506.1 hypothetical protein [Neobacillus sp. MER 74]